MRWHNLLVWTLALLVVVPYLLSNGYLVFLDYVSTPTLPPLHIDETGLLSSITVQLLAHIIAVITPPHMVTKLLILFSLAIAGTGAATLSRHIRSIHPSSIALSCGLLYMLNPLVYNRITMGHIYFLFGYALMPWLVVNIIRYLKQPSLSNEYIIGILAATILLTSIHAIILIPLALVFIVLQYRIILPQRISIQSYVRIFLPSILVILVNIGIAFISDSWTGHTLLEIPSNIFGLKSYCAANNTIDSLLLSANWKTPLVNPLPCETTSLFIPALIILIIVSGLGTISAPWITTMVIISLVLTLGMGGTIGETMRDTSKFLSITVLGYVILLSTVAKSKAISSIVFACVLIVATGTIYSTWQTVISSNYPESWYSWNEEIAQENSKPTILFLPWHQYLGFEFTSFIPIVNPANQFFTNAHVIAGDNIEIGTHETFLQSISTDPRSHEIERVLNLTGDEFAPELYKLLMQHNISYIALGRDDPKEATRLTSVPYLKTQSKEKGLTVWKFVKNHQQ